MSCEHCNHWERSGYVLGTCFIKNENTLQHDTCSSDSSRLSVNQALAIIEEFEYFLDGSISRYPERERYDRAMKALREFIR